MNAINAHGDGLWSLRHADRLTQASTRPAAMRSERPNLEKHERVLLEAALRTGGRVVGTDRALIFGGPGAAWRRIAWVDIAEVAWAPRVAATIVRPWFDGGDVELTTDRRFAEFAADRVAWTQVLRRRVQLTETVTAIVLATRVPGEDAVTWRVHLDPDGVGDDPTVAAAAARALAELRSLTGC